VYEIHRHTTPNGLPVLLLQRDGLNGAEVGLVLRAGPRYETRSTSGLSHMVEHMLFRGTERYPESRDFHWAVESVGGPLMGSTGRDTSQFSLYVSPRDIEVALELLAEATLHPTLADIDLERRLIIEELLQDRDEDDRELNLENLTRQLLWPGDPLGLPIVGSRANVERFTVEDVRTYHRRAFVTGNALLTVAGPLDPGPCLRAVDRAFAAMPAGDALRAAPLRPARPGPHVEHVDDDASQVEVMWSYRAPSVVDPDAQGVALLQMMLGDGVTSRLQWNVCERRALAYNIDVLYDPFADTGVLDVEAAVAPEHLVDLVREVMDTLHSMKERGPSEAELERTLRRYRLALEFAVDSPTTLTLYHYGALVGALQTIDQRLETLPQWTLGRLRALARRVLARGGLALVCVGPARRTVMRTVEQIAARS